jgi:hypothetical protein
MTPITPVQCRAARALVDMDQAARRLAKCDRRFRERNSGPDGEQSRRENARARGKRRRVHRRRSAGREAAERLAEVTIRAEGFRRVLSGLAGRLGVWKDAARQVGTERRKCLSNKTSRINFSTLQ